MVTCNQFGIRICECAPISQYLYSLPVIIDHIRNSDRYFSPASQFATGLAFLQQFDFSVLPPGRTDIDGDSLYIMRQEYETKAPEEGKWESHRVYADIQFVVEGEELIGYAPLEAMTVKEPHCPVSDCTFFSGTGDFIRLRKGQFGVFLPQDVHMPGIAVAGPAPVKKVLVKVLIQP